MLAVVFDMDGVIFDTETVCVNAWKAIAPEFGVERIEEVFQDCIGCNQKHSAEILRSNYGSDFPVDAFFRRSSEKNHRIIDEEGLPIKPGAEALFSWLRSVGAKTAVASSTRTATVERELKMAGFYHYFDVVVGGDMVEKSKPEPDIYLHACRLLGADPKECFAVEDSYNGVRSASRAGMTVIMVPDRLEPTEEMEELAEIVLKDLCEVRGYLQYYKEGERMEDNMGMTNRQFQAFIRLMELVRKLIKLIPEEEAERAEKEFEAALQLIKEDS